MLVYDNNELHNTYYNFYHKKNRVINGSNRGNKYYIPYRNYVEIDDILYHYDTINKLSNEKYIYHQPLKLYRLSKASIQEAVSVLKPLFNYKNIVNDINQGRCLFIIDEHAHPCILNEYMTTLLDTCLSYIGITQPILILSTNPFNNNKKGKHFQCIFWNAFELCIKSIFSRSQKIYDSFHNIRFVCLNSKCRVHRYFLMYHLYDITNFLNTSIVSMKKLSSRDLLLDSVFTPHWNLNELFKFTKTLPYVTGYDDTTHPRISDGQCGCAYGDTLSTKIFNQTAIFITTESEYKSKDNYIFPTEKIYKPIGAKMPFIIFGQPGVCKYLQSLGYKTFNEIWDESYDEEHDTVKRVLKIKNLINTLCGYNNKDFNNIIYRCQSIVEYNFRHMQSRQPGIEIVDAITKFYCTNF
jgi:hypothetical protein